MTEQNKIEPLRAPEAQAPTPTATPVTPDSLAADAIYKVWKELKGFIVFIIIALMLYGGWQYYEQQKREHQAREMLDKMKSGGEYRGF